MISISELDELGKQLSEDFISENKALNEGLKKVASDKGLNKEQIQRVAEMANTETYLNLLKTAKDNYVEFDLADFRNVYDKATEPTQDPFELDDYDKDYTEVASEMGDAASEDSLRRKDYEVKTASVNDTTANATQAAIEMRDAIPFLEEALVETEASFEKEYNNLEKQAKQGILSETPYSDIVNIMKVASPGIYDSIVDHMTPKLASYAPHIELPVDGESKGQANPNSEFYKTAESLNNLFDRGAKLEEAILKYAEDYMELKEAYNLPLQKIAGRVRLVYQTGKKGNIQRVLESLFGFVKNHPKTSIGLGAYAVGRKAGKAKGKQQQGEVLQRSMQFKERKPTILAYSGR